MIACYKNYILMDKTTKNNPAALQKISHLPLLMIIKKTAKFIINGHIKGSMNYLIAEFMNYLSQYKMENHFFCNLCKIESTYFLHSSNNKRILYNSICPNCSSRKRHRGLYEIYKNIIKKIESPKILHFAPEPVFYNLFQPFEYITADLELTDVDLQLDIGNIDCKTASFDLILCNHVLEHVSDDDKALKELFRILKPSGTVIITVPGDWMSEKTINYDQPDSNGHYRNYGLNFLIVLDDIFTSVESIDLYKYDCIYNLSLGLTHQHDLAFLCRKD